MYNINYSKKNKRKNKRKNKYNIKRTFKKNKKYINKNKYDKYNYKGGGTDALQTVVPVVSPLLMHYVSSLFYTPVAPTLSSVALWSSAPAALSGIISKIKENKLNIFCASKLTMDDRISGRYSLMAAKVRYSTDCGDNYENSYREITKYSNELSDEYKNFMYFLRMLQITCKSKWLTLKLNKEEDYIDLFVKYINYKAACNTSLWGGACCAVINKYLSSFQKKAGFGTGWTCYGTGGSITDFTDEDLTNTSDKNLDTFMQSIASGDIDEGKVRKLNEYFEDINSNKKIWLCPDCNMAYTSSKTPEQIYNELKQGPDYMDKLKLLFGIE